MPALSVASENSKNKSVGDFLQKVREAKYPPAQLAEMESQVELLQAAQLLAKIDVNGLAQETWEKLPELRKERAAQIKKEAAQELRRQEITRDGFAQKMAQVASLEKSTEKLQSPDIDEQFKRRAFATEFSIRLASEIRGIHKHLPTVEPSLLEKLGNAHARFVDKIAPDVGRETAQQNAGMLLLECIREAAQEGYNAEQGIHKFVKFVSKEINPESGHQHDVSYESYVEEQAKPSRDFDADGEPRKKLVPEHLQVPSVLDNLVELEEREARRDDKQIQSIADKIQKAALTSLNDREYAIFHVLMDNNHVLDFNIHKETQELTVRKKSREGIETGVTPAKLVREALPEVYTGDGAAYRALNQTIAKISATIKSGKEIELDDKAEQRRGMSPEAVKQAAIEFEMGKSKRLKKRGAELE